MQSRFLILCVLTGTVLVLPSVRAAGVKDGSTQKMQDILNRYYFVADFEQKPAERAVSDDLFWKYPFKLPDVEFPIEYEFSDIENEFPKTVGQGRAIQHINRGRRLYLEGQTEAAKNTWLAARSRFGKNWSHHRRNDYFIAYAFLKLAQEALVANNFDYQHADVKANHDNAATFFAWAYNRKSDIPDDLVERNAAKSFYNMAAIYWRYKRYAGAYGAAEKGLNFLRKTGRTAYRPQFHRFVSEAHIKNRTYLEAVQQLDIAIRQDPNPEQAAAMFARVGDIYFDLNNYELSSDAYRYGASMDEELQQINQAQLILRGESLFWLGKFDEAQKLLHFGIKGANFRHVISPLGYETQAYAALRFADAYLARKEYEKAKLEYYKVGHEYRGTGAGNIALVRGACLELPAYVGKNLGHARTDLEEAKTELLPAPAKELAWACQVASYAERERTPQMVDRVREFAALYPQSRFLRELVEPVRETQAEKIQDYFKEKDLYNAVGFFETNRPLLYKKPSDALKKQLFVAYVDIFQPEKAKEFWLVADRDLTSDADRLRVAVESAEMAQTGDPVWVKRNAQVAKELSKRQWTLPPEDTARRHISRIMAVDSGVAHLPWISKIANLWTAKDETYLCNMKFPAMSRLLAEGLAEKAALDAQINQVIKEKMPALLKTDEGCALSVLDLEVKLNDENLGTLGQRYIGRSEWPLVGSYAHAFWTLSEKIERRGDHVVAKKMWETIVEKAPADSSVRRFALSRLDTSKTEFEALWDN